MNLAEPEQCQSCQLAMKRPFDTLWQLSTAYSEAGSSDSPAKIKYSDRRAWASTCDAASSLRRAAADLDLAYRREQLVHRVSQVWAIGRTGEVGERIAESCAALLEIGATLSRKGDQPAAAFLFGRDQTLILELRDRRIDRARARVPGAAGAVTHGLHDLVAVHWLVGKQHQDGCPHVAALGASATPAKWAAAADRLAPSTAAFSAFAAAATVTV